MVSFRILFVLQSLLALIAAADECQPATWSSAKQRRHISAEPTVRVRTAELLSNVISTGNVTVGEVNCRFSMPSGKTPNYYTCTQLATRYGLTTDQFFVLNPTLLPNCSNIQANTEYCVDGFIEPLRSQDGFCGPQHNNATCIGSDFGQCCNAQTWKCGDTVADCTDGTCYEGACAGDKVYSTDGTCGLTYRNRLCAGLQGDCCNQLGRCGTGEAFCGIDNCQLGNCTLPATNTTTPEQPPWMAGNTTDGTCGGVNYYSCNDVYGNCCNKNNMCGSLISDCGVGCQPEWGVCSSVTITTTNPTTSRTVSTSTSASTKASTSSTSTSTRPTTATTATTATGYHSTTKATTTTKSSSTSSSTSLNFDALPTCGQNCINNMLGQYKNLGCATANTACLCKNSNFGYGIRDCANGACGTAVATTVIAYGSAMCSGIAVTTAPEPTTTGPTTTGTNVAALPICGQTCFNNMVAQYKDLGCASPDPYCLCSNANFGYGLRDCSNGACANAADAAAAIAYGSVFCASASATATATAKR